MSDIQKGFQFKRDLGGRHEKTAVRSAECFNDFRHLWDRYSSDRSYVVKP
jgi:hypothetical protein